MLIEKVAVRRAKKWQDAKRRKTLITNKQVVKAFLPENKEEKLMKTQKNRI